MMSANTATMTTYLSLYSLLGGRPTSRRGKVGVGKGAYSRGSKKLRLLNFFLFLAVSWHGAPLKVVGNEKKGGSRRWRVLGNNLGPWRLTFIFILNMPSAIRKSIVLPFPLVTAKLIDNYFDNRKYGANMNFLLLTRHFICASNHMSVKRDAVQTRKKSASSKLFHILRCKFGPHRH